MRKHYFTRLVVLVFPTVLSLSYADSQAIIEEDFEGYQDESALTAVWPKVGNAITHLAPDPENAANTVLFSKGDRRSREFSSVTPTDDDPLHLRVEYFDDYQEDVSGREYVGLWTGPFDPTSLIEVGLHNSGSGTDTSRYTARVFGSEHGTAWFDLNTSRSAGWHTIDVWVYAENVEIYFDGELDTALTWSGGSIGAVRLGFGAGSGDAASPTGVSYDNLLIERAPTSGGQGTLIELSATESTTSGHTWRLVSAESRGGLGEQIP